MISLVTCTGDRPECFARCERYMARQTWGLRDVQWIVVDDGQSPSTVTMGQEYVRREPSAKVQDSFCGNLRAALERVRQPIVVMIEDDDWYGPTHIDRVVTPLLMKYEVCGEAHTPYYHVPTRQYRVCPNDKHSSLCQTAFRRDWIPWILSHLTTTFVDMQLWREARTRGVGYLYPESSSVVGLKGQPGRKGIGMGHRPKGEAWHNDCLGNWLRARIGNQDANEVLQ